MCDGVSSALSADNCNGYDSLSVFVEICRLLVVISDYSGLYTFLITNGFRRIESLNNKDKIRKKDLNRIRRLRLIDDDFMTIIFDGFEEGVNLLLNVILQRNDVGVTYVKTQKVLKSLEGRDLYLDIYAIDETGDRYNIEFQRSNIGAIPQRTRYHSSMIDSDMLKPGQRFDELSSNTVIFITENDVLELNEPIYHIERCIKEGDSSVFNDGSQLIYVNGEKKDPNTDLGRLMSDLYCTEAKDMYYQVLADRVKYYKETEKGVKIMCQIWDEVREEGILMGKEENAVKMIEGGKLSYEEISSYTGLPVDRIRELAGEKTA